ncbi:hypothetical protein B0H14DRAFT_3862051 [Mycena olivaceomarginata]|nr:hypothetical protein B0H14DRAFT_3862051 [Mycena olivaceomarginata]
MQFNLNFAALGPAIAALTAHAAPATGTLEPLVDGHVFICTDANFSGDCTNYGFFADQRSNFPGEFADDISSFWPDAGWSCTMYTDRQLQRRHIHGNEPRLRHASRVPRRRVQLRLL